MKDVRVKPVAEPTLKNSFSILACDDDAPANVTIRQPKKKLVNWAEWDSEDEDDDF
jgi:hypothetical protein